MVDTSSGWRGSRGMCYQFRKSLSSSCPWVSSKHKMGVNPTYLINSDLIERFLYIFNMEEAQKSEKKEQFKDSCGFEDINEDIDFRLSKGPSSSISEKVRSLDKSLVLDKLSDEFLSGIAKSNLSSVYAKSEKEYEKDLKSQHPLDISNISSLPDQSNVSSQQKEIRRTLSAPKPRDNNIQLSLDAIGSDMNNINVRTQQDNLIFPRQYKRIFNLKKDANHSLIIQKFNGFIKDNGFQTISSNKQNLCVRKAFSKNIFKLLFQFCCRSNSNIADYELSLSNTTLELKLIGESNSQSQKVMKEMEVALWRSHQLELSEDESLRFFIDSEESNKLSNQLKYIMETDDNENGLELCLFSCTEQIDQLSERFCLKHSDSKLSPEGKLILKKHIYLSSQVFMHFRKYFQKQETKLVSKRREILNKMSISQCFDYLEVDPVYRLEFSVISSRIIPYWQAIRILERINYYITPQQKLQCLNSYYQTIQQCCRAYHGGKVVLESMDNILPILIYTLLFARVDYIYANVKIVQMHLRQISVCEPSLKMSANIFASVEYISNCWSLREMH